MASRTSSPLVHPDEADLDLFRIMSALADPVRLGIVVTLASRPGLACSGFYQDVAKSALTRHFRVLREAGLIHQHDVGTRRINTLRKEELDRRFPGLVDLVVKEGADRAAAAPEDAARA
ncbi:helix-turn-helix domain-containing protein [Streptomyces sp. CRN 30]|uniref:ArsR/SmtB family transcription factor n=1 Tax=Streptomyces sp. CRN 30 TaxID=3075613 RepID=UPI002A7EA646|nr:helix-turn-helix domain-containing protein [Streptomyces sp. CRN 30]